MMDVAEHLQINGNRSANVAEPAMLAQALANQPWNSIHPTLLLLRDCKTLRDVNQIHARIITTGLVRKASSTARIVLALSSSPYQPLFEFARYLFFSQFQYRNSPFLWNAILKSFSHGHNPREAVLLFSLMLGNGVIADRFSFSLVLKACFRLSLLREGLQIQCLVWKSVVGSDVFLLNCLICLYCRCGLVEFARSMFDRMPVRDSVSWNSMIDGYMKHGLIDVARELFDQMDDDEKNLVTWNSMINGYVKLDGGLEVARKLFDRMPERDVVSWNSMIDGYVKCGMLEDAYELFEKMPERDVITWANMIHGYAKNGNLEMAHYLFDKMPERDVVAWNVMMAGYVQNGYCIKAIKIFQQLLIEGNLDPDHTTLATALSAVAELGHIGGGKSIHDYIERNGMPLDGYLGVALIDMYSKCGNIETALKVFESVEDRSVDHWNAMIGGLAIHGFGEVALDLFLEMKRLSLRPDDITFIGVLNACSHAGLVKEGLLCFELMQRAYNVEPKVQHYGCLVDILGRAGHLDDARKLVADMPVEPNDVVWRALLSACRNHGNFSIGQQAAKHLIELDSCNSSSYILLSNLYAGVGMWCYVSKVRMAMKDMGIKKVPGCSWIELDGTLHEFVVGDRSHPQAKEIYYILENMCCSKQWNLELF